MQLQKTLFAVWLVLQFWGQASHRSQYFASNGSLSQVLLLILLIHKIVQLGKALLSPQVALYVNKNVKKYLIYYLSLQLDTNIDNL